MAITGMSYADTDVQNYSSTVTADSSIVITSYRTVVTINSADTIDDATAGKAMACTKPLQPSDTDCCTTTGWGTNPALNSCLAQERVLADARNAGTAEYIGDTCIKENGVCKAPISVYCVFPDNISYQIQTQGRKQLGLDFGSADAPNCAGLTANQIKQIDLTQINFTNQTMPNASTTATPIAVVQPAANS